MRVVRMAMRRGEENEWKKRMGEWKFVVSKRREKVKLKSILILIDTVERIIEYHVTSNKSNLCTNVIVALLSRHVAVTPSLSTDGLLLRMVVVLAERNEMAAAKAVSMMVRGRRRRKKEANPGEITRASVESSDAGDNE